MSVKKPSYAGSTTDYSEMNFQPNFTQRVYPPPQVPQPVFNQRISFGPNEPQQTMPKGFNQPYPMKDLNSTFSMMPEVFQMDQDFLPQEILFLLSEEENHLQKFKAKVERDKCRIKKDVDSVKNEIMNMIEDLSVQMQQFVEEHFKRYLNVYAIFKEEVISFKSAKLEAPLNLVPPPPSSTFDECSNANLIRELEEMRYKNYVSKVNAYVSELAKQRIEKVQIISKDLLQLTSQNSELYHSEPTMRQLNLIKSEVEERLITKFGDMTDYILPLDFMQQSKKNEPKVKSQSQFEGLPQSSAIKSNPYLNEPKLTLNLDNQINQFNQTIPSQQSPILQLQNQVVNSHTLQGRINDLVEQQPLNVQHNGMVLCFANIKDNLVATASKDTIIKIWDSQQQVGQLVGHKGGVCTLAVIRANGVPFFLASGSDHGDNSIKIWNLSSLKEHNTLLEHSAAVVALLSLEDGQTLVSGSYDKSLLIWNIDNSYPIQKLTAHTNAITCLTLAKGRFLSGGLDSVINVWKIQQGPNGQFQQAQLERTIKNTTLVCSLNTVCIQNNIKIISGGKDGKIREFELSTGELVSTQQVASGPIVEMIVVQDYVSYSIISMSNKDRNLVMTSQGVNRILDTNDQVLVEFGCGVFPKMEIVDKQGYQQLHIVSQKEDIKKIFKFNI